MLAPFYGSLRQLPGDCTEVRHRDLTMSGANPTTTSSLPDSSGVAPLTSEPLASFGIFRLPDTGEPDAPPRRRGLLDRDLAVPPTAQGGTTPSAVGRPANRPSRHHGAKRSLSAASVNGCQLPDPWARVNAV